MTCSCDVSNLLKSPMLTYADRVSSAKICNSKRPLCYGLMSTNVLMSYVSTILVLNTLYVCIKIWGNEKLEKFFFRGQLIIFIIGHC